MNRRSAFVLAAGTVAAIASVVLAAVITLGAPAVAESDHPAATHAKPSASGRRSRSERRSRGRGERPRMHSEESQYEEMRAAIRADRERAEHRRMRSVLTPVVDRRRRGPVTRLLRQLRLR